MSPQDYIGRDLGSYIFDVERAQLRLFAKVTGERRPMYTDPRAARAAGYRDLPAPPTFAFTIGMKPEDPFEMLSALGGDLARLLHGEQSFEYVTPICAGDRVRVRRQVVDAYQKKRGALTFFVVGVQYEDADTAEPFCSARQVLIVRAPEPNNA